MDAKRILIVDDEPAITDVLVQALARIEGYDVRAVNDAESALAEARGFLPHLVILDIVMPRMDGGELLAELRRVPGLEALPAVFLTGLVSESEVGSSGHEVGGNPVIAKPVRLETLRRVVAERLGGGGR